MSEKILSNQNIYVLPLNGADTIMQCGETSSSNEEPVVDEAGEEILEYYTKNDLVFSWSESENATSYTVKLIDK